MAVTQGRSRRKPSGGRYKAYRGKRKYEIGRLPSYTGLGDKKLQQVRVRGGNIKNKLLMENMANLLDPKTKKCSKVKILNILETPANRHYARRNIVTKGTIIQTEKGKARVTSRPGQHGIVNAVLIS